MRRMIRMRNIFETIKRKDVGSIGIGAMIVFIAMVLVAGIAASVLIQTSTKLETQAMKSGQETIAEVSSGIAVYDIEGKINNSDIGMLAITVRTRAGSANIDLNETVLMMSDGTKKVLLTYYGWSNGYLYNSSVDSDGQLFGTGCYNKSGWINLTNDYFGIIVLEDQDGSCTQTNPIINRGDKVALTVNCSAGKVFNREIPERTDVFGYVFPEHGSPGVIAFTTPASYNDNIIDLQ